MTKYEARFTLARLAIACSVIAALWTATACNGILGNEALEADAGASDAPVEASTEKCADLGQKYCSAINGCAPSDDPAFGCRSGMCAPCSIPNATARCGLNGCIVDKCFPGGFFECAPGQCVDLSEAANCGKCGTPCPSLTPLCAPVGGGFACTATCVAPQRECNKRCVDVASTVGDCGACGNDCRGPGKADPPGGKFSCVNSKCQLDCLAGFHRCGNACVRVADTATCGDMCTPCPTGPNSTPICNNNVCGYSCVAVSGGATYRQCAGTAGCVDIMNDPKNCGGCGRTCGIGCGCTNGNCAKICAVALP